MADPTRANDAHARRWRFAGWCMAAVGLVYLVFGVGIVVRKERAAARRGACLGNQKAFATALRLYLSDHGQFPVASRWSDELSPYVAGSTYVGKQGAFTCPSAANRQCSYAMNSALSGVEAAAFVGGDEGSLATTIGVFESDVGWNAAGGPALLPDEPRHTGGDNYAFPDGHASWFSRRRLPDRTWAKEPVTDTVTWEPLLRQDRRGTNAPTKRP